MRTRHIWQTRLMGVMLGLAMLAMPAVAGAVCGDGLPDLGEDCDPGADVATDCCTAGCEITSVAPAFVCRPAAGTCDAAETCDGVSATCPADAKSTAVCRPAVDLCDAVESCDGVNDACPADSVAGSFVECRPAASDCDIAENCDGAGVACPADGFEANGTPCDDGVTCSTPDSCQGGVCTGDPDGDADDVCNADDNCPTDANSGQEDVDGDTLGDVCDPADGVLNPIKISFKLDSSSSRDNSALKARGDFVTTLPGDVFDSTAPITVTLGDGKLVPSTRTFTWQPTECVANPVRVSCVSPDRLGRASFRTSASRPGVWKFRVRFKQQNLTGTLEEPATASLTYGPSTDRYGEIPDCKLKFNGMLCRDFH